MLCFRGIGMAVAGAIATMITLTPNVGLAADLASIGSRAPSFTLPSQEDKQVSLANYKGK
jgi:peroxiredoxin Q/BCP